MYSFIELNLLGSKGAQEQKFKTLDKGHYEITNYLGPIHDKNKLREILESYHIFAMISLKETFGLVYIEALSQVLPILYTRNQGIDGMFKSNVGESVNPKSVDSIEKGLLKLVRNHHDYVPEQDELKL